MPFPAQLVQPANANLTLGSSAQPGASNEYVVACNERGDPAGIYPRKEEAHAGSGIRHLAIAVLLYNRHGQVLLQLRKHVLFDGIWDITGATHPLYDVARGIESIEDATRRCLTREYGIAHVDARRVGAFTYSAPDGASSENEHCVLLIGECNDTPRLNLEVGYGCGWIPWETFLLTAESTPCRYTPWAVMATQVLRDSGMSACPPARQPEPFA